MARYLDIEVMNLDDYVIDDDVEEMLGVVHGGSKAGVDRDICDVCRDIALLMETHLALEVHVGRHICLEVVRSELDLAILEVDANLVGG